MIGALCCRLKQTLAYFAAKDIASLPQCVIAPLLFTSVLHALSSPLSSLGAFFLPILAIYYTTAGLFSIPVLSRHITLIVRCQRCFVDVVPLGISFVVSVVAPKSLNQLVGVVIVFGLTCFAGGMPTLSSLDTKIVPLCYIYHVSYVACCVRNALPLLYEVIVGSCELLCSSKLGIYGMDWKRYTSQRYARFVYVLCCGILLISRRVVCVGCVVVH